MKKYLLVCGILSMFLFSCGEEEDFSLNQDFLRIFDDRDFNATYDPISVVETASGGILILTEVGLPNFSFSGSSVLAVDSLGEVVSSVQLPDNMVAPVGDLVRIGDINYYACMERTSLLVHLIPVSDDGEIGNAISVGGGLRYPLALSITSDNQFLLLSYDPTAQESIISIITIDGSIVQSQGYSVGTANDIEPLIFEHFTNPLSSLPFFVGEADGGTYFFNGFFDFTLSLVFTDFGENPTGVLQGQRTQAGIRSALHLSNNLFTILGFQAENNFLVPSVSLSFNEVRSSVDFFDRQLPGIRANAPSKSILVQRGELPELVVTATETENRQTILYFHNIQGELLGLRMLGSLNPFTFDDIVLTQDGGLLVLGTTFLSSRFERMYISRISRGSLLEF